jgi:hypothetical protein
MTGQHWHYYEPEMPDEIRNHIERLSADVWRGIPEERSRDCLYVGAEWQRALRGPLGARQLRAQFLRWTEGPCEALSAGYCRVDGSIVRHAWLFVGSGMWVFDPTSGQFEIDDTPRIPRYVVDGLPLAQWRPTQAAQVWYAAEEPDRIPLMRRLRR